METKLQKTKTKVSPRTISRLVIENSEFSSAMGLSFNHLQDIILKSLESMTAISPEGTLKFLKGVNETILPTIEEQGKEYSKAFAESIEALEVEVLSDEEYKEFAKKMQERQAATQAQADTSVKSSNGIVETTWEE